jgi:hypothetical protein
MSVIGFTESAASRSLSVDAKNGFEFTRSFTVQVNKPDTAIIDILNAPGIGLWAAHPEDPYSRAQKFDVKPRGSSLLLYEVTIQYQKVEEKNEDRQEQKPGEKYDPETTPAVMPKAIWSGGTAQVMVPFTKDEDGKAISNSAGIPFDDAEKKQPAPSLTLVKCFPTYTAMTVKRDKIIGKINDAAWAGGDAREWMCDASRWSWKIEGQGAHPLKYVECSFEFLFMKGGWDLKIIDRGYVQKVGNDGIHTPSATKLAPILGQDKKPVKEPVALNGSGGAMDPPPAPGGPNPVILTFKPYGTADFQGTVGAPPARI